MVSMTRKITRTPAKTQKDQNVVHFLSDWQWVKQLKLGLVEDRFCLYLQELTPLTTLDSRRYCEVSLRLKTEKNQLIYPALFLPLAERYNLSHKIDQWVIKNLFEQLVQAPDKIKENYRFALNVSAANLKDYRFFESIYAQVSEFELSPDMICFEISERVALANLRLASDLITDLQTQGYCCALDNCGSNMSSFTYLQYLPVDYLKISERFVKNMNQDITDKAIVELINYIGQSMGLQVIAKGVENQEIFNEVKALDLDYAQGYYLSQPQPMNLYRLV
ncbi:EAL domain-containing protein [Limnoraphis robusta]|uniref:EAL domain-containing protein n=1 Tax=Limnoraphis robusta TaxID=1118279 RepID=UPI00066A9D93|nr:EAL domain-containing protein [Limnoraphis robusta]